MALFDLAAIVATGRQIAAQAREGADTYEILRGSNRTPDGAGGYTETPIVAESGGCILTAGATRPLEQIEADKVAGSVPYFVRNMPAESSVTAQDTIRIGGRIFEVVGVLKPVAALVAITAVCQELT